MARLICTLTVAALSLTLTIPAHAASTVSMSMTFAEAAHPNYLSGCPVFPEGFCGRGQVVPFGQATEMISFGGGCGGSCDLRTITLTSDDQLVLEETFVGGVCPSGSCHHGPVEGGGTGTLTDIVIDGTGLFFGASGTLTGTVRGATSNVRPAGGSSVQLSGTLAYR
jgi:hypothetical protein